MDVLDRTIHDRYGGLLHFVLDGVFFFLAAVVFGFHFRFLSSELPQNMKSGGDKPGEQGTCRQIPQ